MWRKAHSSRGIWGEFVDLELSEITCSMLNRRSEHAECAEENLKKLES